MPKRSQVRVSEGLEARSERPATGYGEPEAGLGSLIDGLASYVASGRVISTGTTHSSYCWGVT